MEDVPFLKPEINPCEGLEAEKEKRPLNKRELIKLVWLRTVNRPPTRQEEARALEHLSSEDSLAEGITDLMWAMLNTKEFLLNH